jgi:hypothetical protein
MKYISVFLSVVLVFPVLYFVLHILELYDTKGPLKTFGFDERGINEMALPFFIGLAIYSFAFLLGIILNLKKNLVQILYFQP